MELKRTRLNALDKEYFADMGILDEPALGRSIDLVASAADCESGLFLDLSDLLGHEDYDDGHGHCKPRGRKKIAEALAPKVLQILNEE